ncbi:BTAD domain-containing putative transcriptional regulator [Nocardiopsis sp. N85]|uniref:AfsR/SARP family transcriptional regulator n=1 Tax=Nocardiopsis sp. N85 TaxID=3029400 RepID=UPI00237FCC5F|nr:AfsR/SARP family transcriptional regulator [Nocardiopsis sp. N85]MDE3723091.1 BTAD domain-containing putative transcriptional regulator [Nocardiopsis sp. N85]
MRNAREGDGGIVFRVLGPIEVRGPNGIVRVPAGRQQTVLGVLLLELGRVVSTDQLVDTLWEHDPPETVRTQVQICVSRLRTLLKPIGATIETRPPGYVLSADPETVDAHVFRARVREATALVREDRAEEAAALLRSAVGLWRGPAFSGIGAEALRVKATHLDEERMAAVESHLAIELDLGMHQRLIGEINTLVEEHPLREGLRAQLMLALYRSGRQAEALEVHRVGRELLIEELGLEPGVELRELERAILAGDPSLAYAAEGRAARTDDTGRDGAVGTAFGTGVAPFQLPTDTVDFVGREDTIREVERTLVDSRAGTRVVVLLGRPGVGKSSTAVRIAHRLGSEHYPDGQLYCDMRATRDAPLSPNEVLGRFLRALGVPGPAVPDDMDERATMYRGLLATRRALIVLDDAATESQILPLIPAGPGCGVLVTSRTNLTGLPGATLVQLDTLSRDTSLELLSQVLGEARVTAEPEAARALVRAVGRLPLALRIVSARLAARRHWTLTSMVDRLADERHRLDELAHGDMTVRASLSMTYDGLDRETARAFGLLGLVDGPTIPMWSAAALLDDDRPFPSDIVEPLVDAHLLDIVGVDPAGEPVYRFHDLVRDYARERSARSDDDDARAAAVRRLMGGWLALLDAANDAVVGGEYLRVRGGAPRWTPPARYVERVLRDPYSWLESERANLRHVVLQAVDLGMDEQCWDLLVGFSVFLTRRGSMRELAELHDRAEPFVRARGNRLGMASLWATVSEALSHRYDNTARTVLLEKALAEYTDLGEVRGQAIARRALAALVAEAGDEKRALGLCEQAMTDFVTVGDLGGQWRSLMLMGYLRGRGGDDAGGRDELDRALTLAGRTGDPRARAQVLRRLAQLDLLKGDVEQGVERLRGVLCIVEEIGDLVGQTMVLRDLGTACAEAGRTAEARELLERSLAGFEQLREEGERAEVAAVLADLG